MYLFSNFFTLRHLIVTFRFLKRKKAISIYGDSALCSNSKLFSGLLSKALSLLHVLRWKGTDRPVWIGVPQKTEPIGSASVCVLRVTHMYTCMCHMRVI